MPDLGPLSGMWEALRTTARPERRGRQTAAVALRSVKSRPGHGLGWRAGLFAAHVWCESGQWHACSGALPVHGTSPEQHAPLHTPDGLWLTHRALCCLWRQPGAAARPSAAARRRQPT